MARKSITITIDGPPSDDNRDGGKRFLIREMPSGQAERWAMRAFLGLARSGVEIPPDLDEQGIAGLARLGLTALTAMHYDDLGPLMDELEAQVSIIEDMMPEGRPLTEDDVEEVATRLRLKREVFGLHVDFSAVVSRWKLWAATYLIRDLSNTETSSPSTGS